MAASVQWYRNVRASVCDSWLQVAIVAYQVYAQGRKKREWMKKAFPELPCKVFLCLISYNWVPVATFSCNGDHKKWVFSFFTCMVEGERKRGLGMDIELANQEFPCNAIV